VLNQDFKEFIQSLNDNQVRYLVIGGYAVALHGYPRYTKDIDIWIEMSPENATRMLQALEQFGFASMDLQLQDFMTPDQVIQLGYPPSRIDSTLLITSAAMLFQGTRYRAQSLSCFGSSSSGCRPLSSHFCRAF
jgi:hypothetical protein